MTRPRTSVAILVALLAVAVYALMWVGYLRNWGWLHFLDRSLLRAAHDAAMRHPAWIGFWQGVSLALGPVPLRMLGSVAAVAALLRREVRTALVLVACAPLSGLVTWAAKGLANRPRPPTMLVPEPSTSFPSGHALEVTAALLALLSFVLPMMGRSVGRAATALAALCVLTVGVARVALNVHYPSDVLAGWSLGYLWFALSLWVIRPPAGFARSPRPSATVTAR